MEDSIQLFYNKKEMLFDFSGIKNEKLIANKIEVFDDVIPSSNSVMFYNLLYLGKFYNDKLYQSIYNNMTIKLRKSVITSLCLTGYSLIKLTITK